MLIKMINYLTLAEVVDLISKKPYKSDMVKKFLKLPYLSKYTILKEFIINHQMQDDFKLDLFIDFIDYDNWEVLLNER